VVSFQFSVFSSQLSVLGSQFSVRSCHPEPVRERAKNLCSCSFFSYATRKLPGCFVEFTVSAFAPPSVKPADGLRMKALLTDN
jgi:hypothetical protein